MLFAGGIIQNSLQTTGKHPMDDSDQI